MSENRIQGSYSARVSAADAARSRVYPHHEANGDEQKFAGANYAMSFTKGLEHGADGLIVNPQHFMAFREAIDTGYIEAFNSHVPVFTAPDGQERRKWEAPTAFQYWDKTGGDPDGKVNNSADRLNSYAYAEQNFPNRKRKTDDDGQITPQTIHRGSSPGVDRGPYLSQFLLIGNKGLMQTWDEWLTVQQGINVNKIAGDKGQNFTGNRRFIHTPRDLATYVHFDALYEAYLNACLILRGGDARTESGSISEIQYTYSSTS